MPQQLDVNNKWLRLSIFLLFIPAFVAYNPFPLYFLNDDFIHIPLSQAAEWGQRNSIRPFGDLSLYLDSILWGNNAVGYHITNLVIHIINTFLIYFLALQLLPRLGLNQHLKFWCVGVALLFWNYAFHSESVFWIIGRSGSLATIFFLLCLLIFLSGKRSWYHFLLSFALFFAGLLTYESVWILPIVLVVLAMFNRSFKSRDNMVLIAGYWLVFLLYFYFRVTFTGDIAGAYEASLFTNFDIVDLGANFFKLVTRSLVAPQHDSGVFLIASVLAVLILLFALFVLFRRKIFTTQWLCWLIVALLSFLPYLSLGIDTHGVEGERYLYLASVFVCIFLIAIIGSFKNFWIGLSVLLLYIFYHQSYLFKAAKAYRFASEVSRKTVEIVKENTSKNHYYFQELPHENYGVPIFRLGLVSGLTWLADSSSLRKVSVISFNQNENYVMDKKPFIQTKKMQGIMQAENYWRPAKSGSLEYVQINERVIIEQSDLLISFTNSSIVVYK